MEAPKSVSIKLIDPEGHEWGGSNPSVVKNLQSSLSGDDLSAYLVKNLGWVKIRQTPTACIITCRPALVAEPCLVTLLFTIHDCAPDISFVLGIFTNRWEYQVLRDRDALTTLLASLTGSCETGGFWPGSRRICIPIEQKDSPFDMACRKVGELVTHADELSGIADLLTELLGPRWSISNFDEDSNEWVELFNGGGFTPFNPDYSGKLIGARLNNYAADPAYNRWVTESRNQTIKQDVPDFSNVDAIVTFARVGEARLRYSRMSLPVTRSDKQRVLVFAARTDQSIDLRIQG